MNKNPIGIYIHIPFCAKKCPYCDFFSQGYNKAEVVSYLEALICGMQLYKSHGCVADTLYFGGGTPSLLSPKQIEAVIQTATEVFALDRASAEITIEANPNTINEAKLSGYVSAGINRISLGAQSMNNKELIALGRGHTAEQTKKAVYSARAAGIENISLDIMLGTPYQTPQSLKETLDAITKLPITHISAYMLTVEENTPYFKEEHFKQERALHCMDEDTLADCYLDTIAYLNESGFPQYEISNFAKEQKNDDTEYKSRHNLKYWRCEEYLGFGASAHSFLNGTRFCNPPSLARYLGKNEAEPIFTDKNAGKIDEMILLALRLNEGLSLNEIHEQLPFFEAFMTKANQLCELGFAKLTKEKTRLFLTPKGMLISNTIIGQLLTL